MRPARRATVRTLAAAAVLTAALGAPACSPAKTAQPRTAQSGTAQPGAPADGRPVRTGVTTHFSQGWPPRLIAAAAGLGTATIRDSLHWPQIERQPGRYDFTERNSGHVTQACRAGMTVLLGLEPRNPNYDGGTTAHTPAGRAAFARYVLTIADRWPGCIVAIEVGNEINGRNGMTGPAAQDRVTAHVALLKTLRQTVKPEHPDLMLVGGSTNVIATGFLARMFAGGLLAQVDAVAVHPYRPEPEGVDWEIARLRAAMARAGTVRPIWATEFSREFPDPAAAPAFYLKMLALLESAGVRDHYWYALIDQSFFPTMGLLMPDGTAKPVANAYAFAARTLAPLGPARRIDARDPTLFHFRLGPDSHVVWGARRSLAASGGAAKAFTADGRPIALPAEMSDAPVVITGAPDLRFGPSAVLADSLYGFAQAPLAWFAQPRAGQLVPLAPVDWQWTSYLGNPALPQVLVNPAGIGTTATTGTVVRYVAPAAGDVVVSVCLRPKTPGAAAMAVLRRGNVRLAGATAGEAAAPTILAAPTPVRAGEALDLVLTPKPGTKAARFGYRLRVARPGGQAAQC